MLAGASIAMNCVSFYTHFLAFDVGLYQLCVSYIYIQYIIYGWMDGWIDRQTGTQADRQTF